MVDETAFFVCHPRGVTEARRIWMYKVKDYVFYGSTGVCLVEDISKDAFGQDETMYYVLKPVYSENMTIRIPVNNQNTRMRPVMTKDEALALIANLPTQDTTWTDDDKQRSADFKIALKTGSNEEWARIIRTIYLERESRSAAGKKLSRTDEETMNTAERFLNQEIALALGISPDEVPAYISVNIPEDKSQD